MNSKRRRPPFENVGKIDIKRTHLWFPDSKLKWQLKDNQKHTHEVAFIKEKVYLAIHLFIYLIIYISWLVHIKLISYNLRYNPLHIHIFFLETSIQSIKQFTDFSRCWLLIKLIFSRLSKPDCSRCEFLWMA